MKKYLYLLCFLFSFQASFSQDLPNSFLNVGVGAGADYGLIGTKMVLGYRNSGFLIGAGTILFKAVSYKIGVQLSVQKMYINYGYGNYGLEEFYVNNQCVAKNMINGHTFMLGGMIGKKRVFGDWL